MRDLALGLLVSLARTTPFGREKEMIASRSQPCAGHISGHGDAVSFFYKQESCRERQREKRETEKNKSCGDLVEAAD